MQQLPWVDIVIGSIVVISALVSIIRGFVKEILSLVAWIAAFVIAGSFYTQLAEFITFAEGATKNIIALLILFFGTLIVMGAVNMIIDMLLDKTGLSSTDRLLGMVFGACRGLLVVCLLVAGLEFALTSVHRFSDVRQKSWYKESVLLPEVNKINTQIFEYLSEDGDLQKISEPLKQQFDKINNKLNGKDNNQEDNDA